MSAEQRVERLYPRLSAQERGVLVLRAQKAGEEADSLIYDAAPSSQAPEFNGYIRLMNAVNTDLATLVLILREQVSKTRLKLAWLQTITYWADDAGSLRALLALNTKEPITASAYARLEAAAREELLPLSDCVQIVAEDHAWTDADYVTSTGGEREASAKAWNRVVRETRTRLEEAIANGALSSRKRGRQTLIAAGVFYDWLGESTPAYPDDAWEYDVRPDAEQEDVEQRCRAQHTVRRLLDRAPKPLSKPVDLQQIPERREEDGGFGSDLERALVISVCDLVRQHWGELRAIEIAAEEVADQFDGEDPMRPEMRTMLDGCLASCQEIHATMGEYAAFDLQEPDDQSVAQVRSFIDTASAPPSKR